MPINTFPGGMATALTATTDALYGTTGIATWPAGVAPGNSVSLSEGLRFVSEAITDSTAFSQTVDPGGTARASVELVLGDLGAMLAGGAGITTWPSAVVYGNAVSIAEALAWVSDGVRKATGTAVGTAKSIVDAIGFDGVTAVASTAGMLRTKAGDQFVLKISVTSSAIPNNTQASGAFTGAASGDILIEDIILETDGTGVVNPTNLEITTDNASGLTGAAAPHIVQAVSALGANKTVVCRVTSATKVLPFLLESTKKLYIDGDDNAGTGAGVLRIVLVCRRLTDGGTLAAGGIGT